MHPALLVKCRPKPLGLGKSVSVCIEPQSLNGSFSDVVIIENVFQMT